MTAVTHPRSRSLDLTLLRGGRVYVWMTLLSLAAAAVSLHWPSTPSYDPWSWLIWGREILHGQLHIAGGSSWKPLPVIFTTVFALFGSAQPNLWLVVARAGALLSVLMAGKLAWRITVGLIAQSRATPAWGEGTWSERLVNTAPAAFAAAIAIVCATFTPHYPGNMMLGYSEGVMTAAFLVATERAWDGHHRQAFAVGIVPCLDRPEVWPLWAAYGLWLMWKDPGARVLVVGLGALMLALWVVPQKLGGGSGGILGLATHAQHNRSKTSAANSSFPFWNELAYTLWPLVLERLEFASLVLTAYTGFLVVRAHGQLGTWRAAVLRYPAAVAGSVAGIFGFLWWVGISLETQAGFAGNPRYAVIGVMFVCISGASAYGWACFGLARLGGALLRRFRRREAPWSLRLAITTALMVAVFLFVPGWFAHRMPSIASIRYSLRYQAKLREQVASLIQGAGGAKRVIACGSMMANNLQVTMVAWYLDVPIYYVRALPRKPQLGVAGPNVVFQDGANSDKAKNQGPTPQQMQAWEQGWKRKNGSSYKIVKTDPVTLYMDCSVYYNNTKS
jgi:hypothetical protein